MPKIDVKPGMFSWIDLMTTDPGVAKGFYRAVFGWDHEDVPTDGDVPYTMFSIGDEQVAGMGEMSPEMKEAGIPSTWNSYIQVDDLDRITGRVSELGGHVELPPMGVMDAGRMSIIHDPSGARVCIWESADSPGAGLFNRHGALTWNELVTWDPGAARTFFSELMGWEWEEMDLEQGAYWVIRNDGRPNGGVMAMTEEWPEETPPHWMVYIGADDVDELADRVVEHGGAIHVPPMDVAVGRFSVVSDPTGAVFTLFRGGDM